MATANMGLTMPTEDGSSGVWDTLLNTLIELIDAHDHTSGKGVLVPSAGLNINAAVAWGGYNLTNMGELGFATTTSGTVAKGLRVVANELTWRTSGGVDVKLTNGTSINTTLVGGITGDYTTTDADCEYDDATKAFEFKQDESPDYWAKLKTGDVHLYEAASGITNYVTVKSPGTLAASYTFRMPTAVPSAGKVNCLTMDENGNVDEAENQLPTALLHDEFIVSVSHSMVTLLGSQTKTDGENFLTFTNVSNGIMVPLHGLRVGERIVSYVTSIKRATDVSDFDISLWRAWGGTATQVGTTTHYGATTAWAEVTTSSVNHTIVDDAAYFFKLEPQSNNDLFGGIMVTVDWPT